MKYRQEEEEREKMINERRKKAGKWHGEMVSIAEIVS
jgi:hypothetical protein